MIFINFNIMRREAIVPICEYICSECGYIFEKLEKSAAVCKQECPACGSIEVMKKVSTFSSSESSPAAASCFSGG